MGELKSEINKIMDSVRDLLVEGIINTGPTFPESKFLSRERFEELLKTAIDARLSEMMVAVILEDFPALLLEQIQTVRDQELKADDDAS